MRWISTVLQVGLALMFSFSAYSKLSGKVEPMREHLGITTWFWTLTGIVEILGAIGLLAGIKYSPVAVLAGLWLGTTMLGAIVSHLIAGDALADAAPASVLLVVALVISTLRWRSAQRRSHFHLANWKATHFSRAASRGWGHSERRTHS